MNAEFHSKMNSAINGLTAAAKPKNSSVELNGLKDETSHFKDLLNRSIKDTGQPLKDQVVSTKKPIEELSPDEKLSALETEENVEDSIIESELTALSPEMEKPLIAVNENDLKNLLQSKAMGFTILRTNSGIDTSFDGDSEAAIVGAGINQLKNKLVETTASTLQAIQNTDIAQSQQMTATQENVQAKSFSELPLEENKSNTQNVLEQKNDYLSSAELKTIGAKDQTQNSAGLGKGTTENSDESGDAEKNGFSLADIKETQNPLESSQAMLQGTEQSAVGKTGTEQEPIKTEDKNGVSSKEIQGIAFANVISDKGTGIQPNNKVELSGQIEKEVLNQLDKNKPVKFMMSLEPGNLGKIDIELKFEQGKLTIDITAFSKETQNLLSAQVDKLVKSLALQNVQVENVQLNMQSQDRMNTDAKTIMMNMGMDFTQGQKHGLLKENIMNQNNGTKNGSLESTDDTMADDLKTEQISSYGNRRINYLV